MKVFLIFVASIVLSFSSQCTDRQKHFNELASDPEWQPQRVLDSLAVEKGMIIGDLGAGGGYYTFRLAAETGDSGMVYAADINTEFLAGIAATAAQRGFSNVDTIHAEYDDSNFPENALDLIFIRNTFHHFENRNDYMKRLVTKLKPTGKIVIIDYKDEGLFSNFGHNVSRREILDAISNTGLITDKEFTFLEKQYFFVFRRK